MKKTFYLIIILALASQTLRAQNCYYDALWLNRHLDNGQIGIEIVNKEQIDSLRKESDKDGITADRQKELNGIIEALKKPQRDSLFSLLKKYFNLDPSATADDINNALKANPFLANLTVAGNVKGLNAISTFSSAIKSVGGLDVTNIANGIADLMIERAKQELTVAFFDRFQKFAKDNPEFGLLFPKTTENLSKLLTYTYPQMLPALRDGFLEDLKQIPIHLDDVLELPRYQTLLRNFPEIKITIRSLRLVQELQTGVSNAADVIKEFASFEEWGDPKLKRGAVYVKVSKLFSESIRNDSTQSHRDAIWVSAKEIKGLLRDEMLFTLYMGLLYQQSTMDKIIYIDNNNAEKEFKNMLAAEKGHLFMVQNKIKEFSELAYKVDTSFIGIRSKMSAHVSPSNDDYYNYINTSIDIVDYGFGVIKMFTDIPASDDYIAIARKGNDIYKDIYTKQYTQAVSDAVDVFQTLNKIMQSRINFDDVRKKEPVKNYSGVAKDDVARLASSKEQVSDKNIDSVAAANINIPEVQQVLQHRALEKLLDFIEKVKPYALFMANMVEAKDENAVKAALANVILPVGSSSIKKNTDCNLSVQSYLGAYLSTSSGSTSTMGTWSDKWGVNAPIGISWTPGFASKGKYGSLSLFGVIFDLGAIVDYKLRQDTVPGQTGGSGKVVTKDYSVQLGQLFSPGAYLVYGFGGNWPLALGYGFQYGPGLSKIDAGGNATVRNPSIRWSFFLSVDLPWFTLVNKNRHK